jgi:hypothetical protein
VLAPKVPTIRGFPRKLNAFHFAGSLINLLVNLFAALDVMRCKPAAHALILQVSVMALSEYLVRAAAVRAASAV